MIARFPGQHRRGFTLLELMVVILLLAITAGAAVPALLGTPGTTPERRVANQLAAALIQTRNAARESGARATLTLSPADGRFWLSTRDSVATGNLQVGAGARIGSDGRDRLACTFDPTGPATPCAITVLGTGRVDVSVNGWSGEIRLEGARAY